MKHLLTALFILSCGVCQSQYFKDAGKQVIDSSRGSNLFPKKPIFAKTAGFKIHGSNPQHLFFKKIK